MLIVSFVDGLEIPPRRLSGAVIFLRDHADWCNDRVLWGTFVCALVNLHVSAFKLSVLQIFLVKIWRPLTAFCLVSQEVGHLSCPSDATQVRTML